MKVMEDVPYVVGLAKWIGTELNDKAKAYFDAFARVNTMVINEGKSL